jgi:uncharacterized membrane protein
MIARGGLLALTLLLLLPHPARADLKLCNRTSYILYAATAVTAGGATQTQGWTRVAPGDCQTAIKGAPISPGTSVYARSALAHSGPQRAWGGKASACVRDGNFTLRQSSAATACSGPDSFAVPFAALDTKGRTDFTMTFDEQPALWSLTAAQLAGVKRLLKDNGFAIAAINGTPDKATGKALNAFRARMKFAANAGNDELFTALETQAQKITAPAGYTVCNDAKEELLVAMGEATPKGSSSHGWWRIPAGACARTITTALKDDAVWLLAQKTSGAVVAGGAEQFCVTPQEFDIARRGDCATRGQVEAGFAKTATRGHAGYIAHIGASGLAPPG